MSTPTPEEQRLSVLHGMIGGGNRRWTAALLRDYVPIKDLAELTALLDQLKAMGLVAAVADGLYVLTDAGRRELGQSLGY
ncbi:MAG: hypothetical protein ACYC6V_02205 [Bacillota bacterium]